MAGDLAASEIVVVAPDQWTRVAAQRIAAKLLVATAARDQVSLALAGGSTPRDAYRVLATIKLPWDRIDCFFGDERAIPADHAGSNYHMAVETLLDPARVPAARRHPMPTDQPDLESAARTYAAGLPERFDLLLLGIGADGHTASLFPRAATLHETARRVVPAQSPVPPRDRLTITPPVIAAARLCMVLVTGASKAAAVARALEGPDDVSACPAQLARTGTWILDSAAAAQLKART
jgi:6-phosphogluconolactonase